MARNIHCRWEANGLNQYTSRRAADSNAAVFSHDIDGNMTGDGRLAYAYDAANRLASVSGAGGLVVSNLYDSLSRRARKITPEYTATYFYDGWNLIEERVAYTNGQERVFRYLWGKDLSESMQGAGGVGGLLYVKRNGAVYIPCYDANGNITDYIDASGAVVASYAYDAFGRAISASGPALELVRFRYSTKYFDDETGLYYYGYRFYSPELMRWLNRDPIEESGVLNLYAFCLNNAISSYDVNGLYDLTIEPTSAKNIPWYEMHLGADAKGGHTEMSHKAISVEIVNINSLRFRFRCSVTIRMKVGINVDSRKYDIRGSYGHEQQHVEVYYRTYSMVLGSLLREIEGVEYCRDKKMEAKRSKKVEEIEAKIAEVWNDGVNHRNGHPAEGKVYQPIDGVMPSEPTAY